MPIINFEAFIIAITILTLTPGLDTALVIRNTTRAGVKDGCTTSLGVCCGLFVHAFFSAVGISALLLQSADLFAVVKMIGAGYLIWLGISSLRALRHQSQGLAISATTKSDFVILRSFREGFLSNVLNPKTAIFYLAFLPQFIDPKGSAFLQVMFMVAIHFIIAMVWQCSLASLINVAKNMLKSSAVMRWMEGITGGILISLGLMLFLEK